MVLAVFMSWSSILFQQITERKLNKLPNESSTNDRTLPKTAGKYGII
jgi:hypothetical protein